MLDECEIFWPLPSGRSLLIAVKVGDAGVERVHLAVTKREGKAEERGEELTHLRKAKKQILEYLRRERTEFDVPLSPVAFEKAGNFRLAVWDSISRIPYGKTKTYGMIAREIGRPGASRAVGTATGKNPIPIIIPCHRVVRKNDMGEFSGGGREVKRFLLDLEQGL